MLGLGIKTSLTLLCLLKIVQIKDVFVTISKSTFSYHYQKMIIRHSNFSISLMFSLLQCDSMLLQLSACLLLSCGNPQAFSLYLNTSTVRFPVQALNRLSFMEIGLMFFSWLRRSYRIWCWVEKATVVKCRFHHSPPRVHPINTTYLH